MDQTSTICLWLAYLLYAAAFAVFVVAFFTQRPGLNRLGLMAAAVSLVFHTAALITRGVSAGHFPFVGAYESLMMVSWAITRLARARVVHEDQGRGPVRDASGPGAAHARPGRVRGAALAGAGAEERHRHPPCGGDAGRHRLPLRGRRRGADLPGRRGAAAPPPSRRGAG